MKEFATPKVISLFFIFILVSFLLEYQLRPTNFLGLVVQIVGGFIATFIGVYLSMHYTKKQEDAKDARDSKKALLGSLQLLWSEMSINRRTMNSIYDGINTMPRIHSNLLTSWQFLLAHGSAIRSNVFYSVAASGGMDEVVKKDRIFKYVLEAYYNMDIIMNGFKLTENIFRDYMDEDPKITLIEDLWGRLDHNAEKLKLTIESNDKARKLIAEHLSENGINLSEEISN